MWSGMGEPNRIEPNLMTGVSGDHRTAARLRHVSDEKPRPTIERAHIARQPLEIIEQARIAPIPVAREPHHLPIGTVDWERDAARQAAFGIGADRARLKRRGRGHGAKQSFAGPFGTALWPQACSPRRLLRFQPLAGSFGGNFSAATPLQASTMIRPR
jgi:hypothetical protein